MLARYFDLESADYLTLADMVGRWREDFDLAREAWAELQARRRVIDRLGWTPDATERYGAQVGPIVPPWWQPPRPRARRWNRPESGSIYLGPEDEARAALERVARDYWGGRRAAEGE